MLRESVTESCMGAGFIFAWVQVCFDGWRLSTDDVNAKEETRWLRKKLVKKQNDDPDQVDQA